jgi:hypothetical protein
MLRSSRYASDLYETHRPASLAGRVCQPTAFWSPVTALRIMCGTLRESLAASRQYEDLRSRGVSHDTAVREALGFGPSPSRATRETAKPLCFAGKA